MKMSHRYVAYCPPNLQTDTHLQVLCGVNNSRRSSAEIHEETSRASQSLGSSDAVKEAVCTCTRRPMLTAYFYRQADLHSVDCRIWRIIQGKSRTYKSLIRDVSDLNQLLNKARSAVQQRVLDDGATNGCKNAFAVVFQLTADTLNVIGDVFIIDNFYSPKI